MTVMLNFDYFLVISLLEVNLMMYLMPWFVNVIVKH